MARITRKRIIIAAIIALGLFVMLFGQGVVFHLFPEFAFRQLTGRPVPPGVRVTAFTSKTNDNFFRNTYYWRLEHNADGFTLLQQGAEFHFYSDDVAGYIAEVRDALAPNLRDKDISEIRQWSRDGHRSQLILQQRGGLISYYVLSTI
jgi:hypothetical protein